MDIKTRADLRNSLLETYDRLLDLDVATEGSVERDIFVEAPIEGQLIEIWEGLDYLQKLQSPLLYENDILDIDKDRYCRNHQVGDIPATYAYGEVTLYSFTAPAKDVVINNTHTCLKEDNSVTYRIMGFYTIPKDLAHNYYNANAGRYEITVQIMSTVAGSSGNTPSNTITKLSQSIPGIDSCTNRAPVTRGEDAGTINQRMQLVKQKYKGRSLANAPGIVRAVQNFASSVTLVGSNDPLMLRTEGMGGAVDIYVKGRLIEGYVDPVTVTADGLLNVNMEVKYDETSLRLHKQPVLDVVVFIKNGITLDRSYYKLEKDIGILKNSTRAVDKIVLTPVGYSQLGPFVAGDVLEVRYNYNLLLHNIESYLNIPENLYDNRDYLLIEKTQVSIHLYAKIKLYPGYDKAAVENVFGLNYADDLNVFSGDYVELADIVGLLKNTAGVDNIDLSTIRIYTNDDRTKNASGDIPIFENEYPITGNIIFDTWTN